LLIAIFALMLVSVVAIALVVSTGTDSALATNYRTASGAYYAGLAGLEEARGRLLWKNSAYLGTTFPNLVSSAGLPTFSLTQVLYILNDPEGTTISPQSSNPAYYPDTEYATEFSWGLGGAEIFTVSSMSFGPGTPGPEYKWVRINAVTQQALNIDVNNTGSGQTDAVDLLYYDPGHVNPSSPTTPAPSLVVGPPPAQSDWVQVLEITAYAVMPNGTSRILQYLVAPLLISPNVQNNNFPAALTVDNGPSAYPASTINPFAPPNGFQISGVDSCSSAPPHNAVASVAYTSNNDQPYLSTQISSYASDFPGAPLGGPPSYTPTTPSFTYASGVSTPPLFRQSWLTPQSLDAVMQDIVNSADVILPTGSTPATYFTGSGSNFAGTDLWNAAPNLTTSPMTVVVNGNLTLNGAGVSNPQGNGLLLVTGTLYYHPTANWNGIILVVGQGNLVLGGPYSGSYGINGSVFVAQTRNTSGTFLGNLAASVSDTGGGSYFGNGITYNSCTTQTASGPITYKVLSFHEIPTS
jgi:hypothetical protein